MDTEKLLKLMKEKAEAVQAIVSKIIRIKDAFQYAVDVTKKQGGQTVVAVGLEATEQVVLAGVPNRLRFLAVKIICDFKKIPAQRAHGC